MSGVSAAFLTRNFFLEGFCLLVSLEGVKTTMYLLEKLWFNLCSEIAKGLQKNILLPLFKHEQQLKIWGTRDVVIGSRN